MLHGLLAVLVTAKSSSQSLERWATGCLFRILPQNLADLFFVDWLALVVKFELIFRATHSKYLEPIDFGYKFRWCLWH